MNYDIHAPLGMQVFHLTEQPNIRPWIKSDLSGPFDKLLMAWFNTVTKWSCTEAVVLQNADYHIKNYVIWNTIVHNLCNWFGMVQLRLSLSILLRWRIMSVNFTILLRLVQFNHNANISSSNIDMLLRFRMSFLRPKPKAFPQWLQYVNLLKLVWLNMTLWSDL